MRSLSIAAASAAALLAVAAQAQTSSPAVHPAPASKQTFNPLHQADVSKILGKSVYGSDNEKIGDVSTVLIDPQSHKVDRLVVRSGSVPGAGGRLVALPVRDFRWNGREDHFTIAQTSRQVRHMSEWSGAHPIGPTGSGRSVQVPLPPHAGR